jgi:hypothetical protein
MFIGGAVRRLAVCFSVPVFLVFIVSVIWVSLGFVHTGLHTEINICVYITQKNPAQNSHNLLKMQLPCPMEVVTITTAGSLIC